MRSARSGPEGDDQLARLGSEGVVDSRLQHLPSTAERSAKDLDKVVALAAQRKYRALVDRTPELRKKG